MRTAPFYKMSGSGNDFVFFDVDAEAGRMSSRTPEAIQEICARGTGVGADGVVFFSRPQDGVVDIRYYNSDGSGGELCGNATLCRCAWREAAWKLGRRDDHPHRRRRRRCQDRRWAA